MRVPLSIRTWGAQRLLELGWCLESWGKAIANRGGAWYDELLDEIIPRELFKREGRR